MINTLKQIFGIRPSVDYTQLVKQGATIIDVRSKREFSDGHIKGSLNIPVDQLSKHLNQLPDKSKALITCCASGMRSASAKSILKSYGYTEVHNGGSWVSLKDKI